MVEDARGPKFAAVRSSGIEVHEEVLEVGRRTQVGNEARVLTNDRFPVALAAKPLILRVRDDVVPLASRDKACNRDAAHVGRVHMGR